LKARNRKGASEWGYFACLLARLREDVSPRFGGDKYTMRKRVDMRVPGGDRPARRRKEGGPVSRMEVENMCGILRRDSGLRVEDNAASLGIH
jgi:hypothetical protein